MKRKTNVVVTDNTDTLKQGRFLTINRIFVTGNRITRDRIILRELSLKPGDTFFSNDLAGILELDRRKLLNTRLFNTVEIKTLELEPLKIDLVIDVNERWYTFPAPIFDIADRNFNEWWQNYDHDLRRVNYGLRLYQYNMRGRNETLRFHAQFGFQRRFELMYRFPYIDRKQKQGLTIDLSFTETKNTAFKTDDHKYVFLKDEHILKTNRLAGLTYSYRNSFYETHSLRVEYFDMHIDDTLKLLNPIYYKGEQLDQQYTSLTYTFNSDRRDFISYPLIGYQFMLQATRNGLLAKDDLNKFETTLTYSKYWDLKKNYYLSNNTIVYTSYPDDVSFINYGVLGLRRQFVRGYELYVIEGPHFFLNKTTFKKLLFSRKYHWSMMPISQFRHLPLSIYLKTYADVGYVKNYPDYKERDINTRLSDKLLGGTGLGLDVVGFYDLVLRFEYTINAETEHGFFFHIKREF
ncbi:POTRA domain-containing protein [Chryseosolibacter indicus]|uniref:BamA/TamA family outer membrane protein n=1 Tax=Chryseosolibacter indicus TaxID=2782351 RepID=A0ABS5VVL2_9BACT|nr:POTRA domain-containing protein [Chryseosolibacter indicus]MBT1705480.1 BamA/TamA family outer membrane protein [Chryseosolibacter indicus]